MATHAPAGTLRGKISITEEGEKGRALASKPEAKAVVYVTGFDEPPPKRDKIYLDQKNKTFLPRVLAVTVGETITFRNQDDLFHNVWSVSQTQPFDLGSYRAPEERSVTFRTPGLVRIFCNVHPQMITSVLVLKNRRHAVVGPGDTYSFPDLPPGNLEVRVWAEGAEPVVRPVVMTRTAKLVEDMAITVKPVQEHMNKYGKPYAADY